MSMDFVRSSILAGKNVDRLLAATIRGAVRRNDADGGSLVPYFPSIITKTLNISTETGSYSVTFTGNGIATVIADINAALTTHGAAYDADGVVAIQTSVNGGGGWIEVTGGSGASILGFDLNLGRRLVSVGGDLPSAPEGRIGNPLGTMFPGKGDDFKMGVFQRPLAALAANVDVIHSDVAKQDAVLQLLGTLTAVTDGGGCHFSVPTSKIYNGYDSVGNKLSVSSTPTDLSAYFVLLDVNTRRRLPNYVSAVVVGNTHTIVAGTATSMTDTGKSALGANILKANYAIIGITDGRVIHASGAGSTAVVGDLIEITGATNLVPWDNNGIRWVCDGVISTDYISVRPASKAELAAMGQSSPQGQLQTSLNGNPSGPLGSINIYTGPYVSGVSLVVTPSITNGTTVEIWAAQPLANRDRRQTGTIVPSLSTPLVFSNRYDSSSFPHLATRRNSVGDTADLFQFQDQTGAYLLKVTSSGNLTAVGNLTISATGQASLSGSVTAVLAGSSAGVTATTQVGIYTGGGGSPKWNVEAAGTLRAVDSAANLLKSSADLTIGTDAGYNVNLETGTVTRWIFDTGGNIQFNQTTGQTLSKTTAGTLTVSANNGLILQTASTDLFLKTDSANGYGWKLDSSVLGQLKANHASSHTIIGNNGLFLDDGAGRLFLTADGTGYTQLQGTQAFGAATPSVRLYGVITGANGTSVPGIQFESSGTNAGIQFKTAATVRWTVDASGNLSAPAAATVQTTSGALSLTGATSITVTASSGDASISGTNVNLQNNGQTKWQVVGSAGDIDGRVSSALQMIKKTTSGGLSISYSGGGNSGLGLSTGTGSGSISLIPGNGGSYYFNEDGTFTFNFSGESAFNKSNGTFSLKTTDANSIKLFTNGTSRWEIDSNGKLWNRSSGDLDMNSHKVTSVLDPSSAQDAATKNYVDSVKVFVFGAIATLPNGSLYVPWQANGSYRWVAPRAGTVHDFYAEQQGSGTAATYSATLYKNSSAQTATVNMTEATSNFFAQDTTHTFTVAAGDYIEVYLSGANAASITVAFGFTVTVA